MHLKCAHANDTQKKIKLTQMDILEDQLIVGTSIWAQFIYRYKTLPERERARPGYRNKYLVIWKITESIRFESFLGIIMILNGLYIAQQVSVKPIPESQIDANEPIDWIEHLFVLIFVE